MRFLASLLLAASTVGAAHAAPVNLVTNGGFETGDFTGWTQFGNTSFNGVSCAPGFGFASSCAAFFGPIGTTGGISQTLTSLSIGSHYLFGFELSSTGDVPSSYAVSVGGVTLLAIDNPPATGSTGAYAFRYVDFTATATTETIAFTFRDDPGFFILDAVSVTLPEPSSLALAGVAIVALGLARRRRMQR